MLLAVVLGALLAMLIAGGVALADDITCDPGSSVDDPCKGTLSADTLTGTPGRDSIEAGSGKDVVYGLGAHDTLLGQSDNDVIRGDDPPANYTGDPGDPAWDAIYGGLGGDNMRGNQGADVLYAANANRGDNRHDVLRGGAGIDVFVVDKEAYASGEDDIIDDQEGLGVQDGIPLPSGATADDLHQSALNGGPVLYYYPS